MMHSESVLLHSAAPSVRPPSLSAPAGHPARRPASPGGAPGRRTLSHHLASLISPSPDRVHVEAFVQLCHRVAAAYLRQKVKSNALNPEFFGVSMSDLALDCVADLFARNEEGRFVQLESYFKSINWRTLTEHELFVATRRLVFSSVSQSLMRRYRSMDPSLSKLIRNLKNAVKRSDALELRRRGSELWIFAKDQEEGGPSLVTLPPELLEGYLSGVVTPQARLDDMLSALLTVLDEHPAYVRGYPLTLFAQVVRTVTVRVGEATPAEADAPSPLHQEELRLMLDATVDEMKAALHKSYVARRKVNEATFNLYFTVVRDQLEQQYLFDTGANLSNQQALQARLRGLTLETYRQQHRSILEYFVKLVRTRFIERVRYEWA